MKKARKFTPPTKPLTIYYYGDGKGKTSAGLGAALRAAGHNYRCLILQAIKGDWPSGEQLAIPRYLKKMISIKVAGKGFMGIMGDKLPIDDHKKAAEDAIKTARDEISNGRWDLVVLDEYGDLPNLNLATIDNLLMCIPHHRKKTDVIVTGHKPIKKLINYCDLVTNMKKVKHPFDSGIIAKKGIDF